MSGNRESSQSAFFSSHGASGLQSIIHSIPAKSSSMFDESESDESEPDTRTVTRVITSAKTAGSHKTTAFPTTKPNSHRDLDTDTAHPTSADNASNSSRTQRSYRDSQIARLVRRREKIEKELTYKLQPDTRDLAIFRFDLEKCPDHSDTRVYEQTPVDGFGEAMLRAMGWKGSVGSDKKHSVKPRPPRLGLGAKLNEMPPPSRKIQKRARLPEETEKPDAARETLKGLSSEDEVSDFHRISNKLKDGPSANSRLKSRSFGDDQQSIPSKGKKRPQQVSSILRSLTAKGEQDREELVAGSHERPSRQPSHHTARATEVRQHCSQDKRSGQKVYDMAEAGQVFRMKRQKFKDSKHEDVVAASGRNYQRSNGSRHWGHYEKREKSQDTHREDRERRASDESILTRAPANNDHPCNPRGRQREMASVFEGCEKRGQEAVCLLDERGSRSRQTSDAPSVGCTGRPRPRGMPDKMEESDNGPRERRSRYDRATNDDHQQSFECSKREDNNGQEAVRTSRKRRSRFSDFG